MSNKKEVAIGEEVCIDFKRYVCTESTDEPCKEAGCDLQLWQCRGLPCVAESRTDGKNVVFKLKEE